MFFLKVCLHTSGDRTFLSPLKFIKKGVIKMLELEETIKQLQELQEKIKNLGESL